MGRRFSVRVQLQSGVLGKVWSESAAACSNIPASGAVPEPQFPFFLWGFEVPAGQLGCSGAAPQHIPPLSTAQKKSLTILSPKIPVKPRLCLGGRITNPSWCGEASSPSPDGVAGPSTGSVLVPSARCCWGSSPSSCPLLQHPQFPNPRSQIPFFSPVCSACAVLRSQPAG